ncbi:MAG: cupin domain-containing protein [Actinomycetota bacterium]|nr:cupin domain-containing protein [Actinomycetota bacterium]
MKATAAETGGSLFIFEDAMAQSKTTPLHLHPEEEEAIYVLEGELLVHVDGEEHPVSAGGLIVAPRGVPHALLVTSTTARVLAILSPGKAEAFYRGASEPASSDTDPSGPRRLRPTAPVGRTYRRPRDPRPTSVRRVPDRPCCDDRKLMSENVSHKATGAPIAVIRAQRMVR